MTLYVNEKVVNRNQTQAEQCSNYIYMVVCVLFKFGFLFYFSEICIGTLFGTMCVKMLSLIL